MLRQRSFIFSSAFVLANALTSIVAHAGGNGGIPATSRVGKAVSTGSCITNRSAFAASTYDGSYTALTTFVDFAENLVTFRQGGLVPGCVIVNFSGMSFTETAALYVRALLDGGTVAVPPETLFSGDDDEDIDSSWSRSHAYTFVFPSVSPGVHTVRMQFRSNDGNWVFMHRHTTVVQHR